MQGQGIAAEALKSILLEYVDELDDKDPTDLQSVEEITLDIAAFVAERMPASENDGAEDDD